MKKLLDGQPDVVLVFDDGYLSHLEGKLLTIIEAMGLENRQEESIKSLIRNTIWDDAHNSWASPALEKDWQEWRSKQLV